MKLSDQITKDLMKYLRSRGGYRDYVLPNFYVGKYEMDIFRVTGSGYIQEYEIKTSRSDFRNDFNKEHYNLKKSAISGKYERLYTKKHDFIKSKNYPANKFYFVVPKNLISIEEVPDYCGLIYYNGGWFEEVKQAKMLHSRKISKSIEKDITTRCYMRYMQLLLKMKNAPARMKEMELLIEKQYAEILKLKNNSILQ